MYIGNLVFSQIIDHLPMHTDRPGVFVAHTMLVKPVQAVRDETGKSGDLEASVKVAMRSH